ncbi:MULTISPECIES: DUF2147 domain-containing protein [Acinetobacter]|uniref:DUF2147 domain-containing protein n=1 Tax=Acinetobacter piscicola TaxID=2006115 RepID=A0A4Q4GSI5_9GAMM|nr:MULTISPECIES: DUF2147 domain-containing protein [Acinetobacter]QOW47139.1 DUF2147 domain-containing protein [Acinetobacter piscicola]RYL23055.1 DUF2147 domain-containing protein [Acinetobacter piscicola]
MKNTVNWIAACLLTCLSSTIFAQDITGSWQSIDDKTGSPKGIVEIKKDQNGTYYGIITKVTPRVGYQPKEICVNCPAPYTNKPILGLKAITNLKRINDYEYENGKILDPNSGRLYSLKAKLSQNGSKLNIRGYYGFSTIGRSQTWIRIN